MFQMGLLTVEHSLVMYDVIVDSPIVVHDSMISIITMTSTPTMRVVGGLGVTYGAGQKVVVLKTVAVVVTVELAYGTGEPEAW